MGVKTRIRIAILIATALMMVFLQIVAQDTKAVIIDHHTFVSHYRNDLGCPELVRWCLQSSDLGCAKRKSYWKFRQEPEARKPRVTSGMYTHSGYERGHMCPAADRSASVSSMKSTFIMSNVCPQAPALNKGVWKSTEVLARHIAQSLGACSVYAAPLYLAPDTTWIGRGRIAVPDAFFKCIFRCDSPRLFRFFIVENR